MRAADPSAPGARDARDGASARAPEAFTIVAVCTGNRARSPTAVAVLRQLLDGLPVRVDSAGTLRIEDGPALPEAVAAAARLGVDLSSHRSRWIGDVPLADVDLVLGFERIHIATAVVEGGVPRARAFLLEELAALLEHVGTGPGDGRESGPERARILLEHAHDLRGRRRDIAARDLADPFGRPARVFESTAERVADLCGVVAERLFGVASARERVRS